MVFIDTGKMYRGIVFNAWIQFCEFHKFNEKLLEQNPCIKDRRNLTQNGAGGISFILMLFLKIGMV